jgi:hypothetical protein
MSITCRPADNAAKSWPDCNGAFRARWGEPVITGPDLAAGSAFVWHAGDLAAHQEAIRRSRPAWRRAERQWTSATRIVR